MTALVVCLPRLFLAANLFSVVTAPAVLLPPLCPSLRYCPHGGAVLATWLLYLLCDCPVCVAALLRLAPAVSDPRRRCVSCFAIVRNDLIFLTKWGLIRNLWTLPLQIIIIFFYQKYFTMFLCPSLVRPVTEGEVAERSKAPV